MIRLSSRYTAPTSIRQNRPLIDIPIFRPLHYWITCVKRNSSLITPVSLGCVIRTVGNIQNICCVYVGAIIFRVKKCPRFFCLTYTMGRAVIK